MAAVLRTTMPVDGESSWAAAASLGGVMLALITQVAWLKDPDPVTNWTLPEPGRFNFAGYYHAAFLTTASGVFSAGLAVILKRVHVTATSGSSDNSWSSVAAKGSILLGTLLSFAALVAVDNAQQGASAAGTVTLAAIISGVIALSFFLAKRPRTSLIRSWSSLLLPSVGAAVGFGVSAAYWPRFPFSLGAGVIAIGVGLGAAVSMRDRPFDSWTLLSRGLVAGPLFTGSLLCAFRSTHASYSLAYAIGAIALASMAVIITPASSRERRTLTWIFGSGYPLMVFTSALAVHDVGTRRTALIAVSVAALGFTLFLPLIQSIFHDLIFIERHPTFSTVGEHRMEGRDTWTSLGLVSGTGLVALGSLLIGVARPLGLGIEITSLPPALRFLAIGGLMTLVLVGAGALLTARSNRGPEEIVSKLLLMLGALTWTTTAFISLDGSQVLPTWFPAWAAAAALVVAIFWIRSVLSNARSLHLEAIQPSEYAIAIVAGTGVGLSVFWLLTTGFWVDQEPVSMRWVIAATSAVLVCNYAMLLVIGRWLADKIDRLTQNEPTLGLVQDGANLSSLVVMALVVPSVVLSRYLLSPQTPLGIFLVTVASFEPIWPLYVWELEINREHLASESGQRRSSLYAAARRFGLPPDEVQDLRVDRLWRYLRFQNAVSGALVALSGVGILLFLLETARRGSGSNRLLPLMLLHRPDSE